MFTSTAEQHTRNHRSTPNENSYRRTSPYRNPKMQKIAIIQISEEGKNIARLLLSQIFAQKNEAEIISRTNVGKRWKDFDAFVFIGAMGICVRTIAPYIKDKHEDPAVVCVDSMGLNAISVLSGHVGDANNLTRDIAADDRCP